MSCCHYYEFARGRESIFAVDPATVRFGPGVIHEIGEEARALGLKRVLLFTDINVGGLEIVHGAQASLRAAGVDVVTYDEARVEPTDASFLAAACVATQVSPDGFVSIGGGSVIDTCKAANLYSTYPAELLTYVNVPLGAGQPVPAALKPHIACPTTSGTGSECTGIAVFDLLAQKVKTGIASRRLRPTIALIDPTVTRTLPANVVAASGFDVLSHALESYTARPFTIREAPRRPALRPMSQGANPWSDIGCVEALKLTGRYLLRAVADVNDEEARHGMMFAATLAGIAFGNSGVHLPHAMSYSVAGLIRDYCPAGYPQARPICPHGISVIVDAPAVFRVTAEATPSRHLEATRLLGADMSGAGPDDAGEVLATRLIEMMREAAMPNGIAALGYGQADIEPLARGGFAQQRLVRNAPMDVTLDRVRTLYSEAMQYW